MQSNNLSLIHPDTLECEVTTTPISNMPFDEVLEIRNSDYISSEAMELSDETTDWDKIFEEIGNKEREDEDAYDLAFQKQIMEKFNDLYPPVPPLSEEESREIITNKFNDKIGDGKFDYIKNNSERKMLKNAWQAISETDMWDFVGQDIESFMWCNDPNIDIISSKMEDLGYNEHSGTSFGCTMRNMQYLVQFGEEKFKKLFIVNNDNNNEDEISDIDEELKPYLNEDAMEYEERLKTIIKKRVETKKADNYILEYMGGY